MATPYDDAATALKSLADASTILDNEIANVEKQIQAEMMKGAQVTGNSFSLPALTLTPALQTLRDRHAQLIGYRAKHQEWGRKVYGVMMGYEREMRSAHKNLAKGREVGFARADVTVGTNQGYAKAVQHKHTISPENSAVNDMITKAANQLTGESGEAPLTTQRRIIDVMINDQTNWWPFDLKHFNGLPVDANLWDGIIPFTTFAKAGSEQILAQLSKYKKGSKGLNSTTANSLSNATTPMNVVGAGKSSRTFFQVGTGPLMDANVITIKMVYGHPRPFKDGATVIRVRKAVFAAFRIHGVLTVGLQQTTDAGGAIRQHNLLR